MTTQFSVGKRALGICDRCGFAYKLAKLKKLVINEREVNIMVCPSCWEKDHPQNMQGKYPVSDPQALRNPRSDAADNAASRVPADIADLDSLNNG